MLRKFALVAIALVGLAIFAFARPSDSLSNEPVANLAGLASLKSLSRVAISYETAIASGRPTLVEFYADWCTTCQGMAPMLQDLHGQTPELNFVAIDIDAPQSADLMARYEVRGVPRLVVLDRSAAISDTFVGAVPRGVLDRAVSAAIAAN